MKEEPSASVIADEFCRPGQRPRGEGVIRIEEHDVRACGLLSAPIPGVRPLPVLGIDHDGQIQTSLKRSGHLHRVISGGIVHHHDLQVVETLRHHRFETTPNVGLTIEGRDHHREEGSILQHLSDTSQRPHYWRFTPRVDC